MAHRSIAQRRHCLRCIFCIPPLPKVRKQQVVKVCLTHNLDYQMCTQQHNRAYLRGISFPKSLCFLSKFGRPERFPSNPVARRTLAIALGMADRKLFFICQYTYSYDISSDGSSFLMPSLEGWNLYPFPRTTLIQEPYCLSFFRSPFICTSTVRSEAG